MEDPESKWEIQEYSFSKEGDTDDQTSMLKWILNKEYGIGKKMIIAGVAISSAPILLPPLVVFSAMGVAFSVPFGVGFASYACTNKIMSTLLPIPPSPLMLEYYTNEYQQDKHEGAERRFELDVGGDDYRRIDLVQNGYYIDEYDDDDDDDGQEVEDLVTNVDGDVEEEGYDANEEEKEGEDDEYRRENVVEEEDNEQMEGLNQGGVDIVFELDEGGDGYGKEGEASIMNVDEESYYANENEHEKEMEDHLVQRENVIIEEEQKEQMDQDIKQEVEMRLGLDVAGEEQGYVEDVGEYLVGDDDSFEDERKGEELLIESQNDENKSYTWEETANEKEEKVEGCTGLSENIRDEGNVNNTVEDDYLLDESVLVALVFEDARDVETTEPVMVKEIDSEKLIKDGSKNAEPIGEMRHIVILADGNEDNNFNLREVEELDPVAREVKGDTNKKARNTESEEKVMRESMRTQEETGGYKSNDGNEDARELGDESGFDLFDKRNTNINFARLEVGNEAKENSADETVDVLALPAFIKKAPLATDNGKVASKTKTDPKIPSREDILDNEKIWGKIGAMRTIVGYKAPTQPTCIGEIKALYVFTGVEPPASFKDDSDLDEVNAKLKFLMSIVGVK